MFIDERLNLKTMRTSANVVHDGKTSDLGTRLRLRRKVKRMTLASVAESAGISTALLSQIERGNATISIDKLVLLCKALEMPLSWLLDPVYNDASADEESRYILRKEAQRHISFSDNGIEKDMLTPDSMTQLQMMRIVLSPDGTTGEHPYNESEGTKCGLVLRGILGIEIDGNTFTVNAGDSFFFSAKSLIRFWAEGVETELFWVTNPAFY
ncbi:XRE family transcriptional regulator [Gibbsiella quercinecans]|nr:XRE family transcriptional regulator [Gibbsiella quercinecans]TCT90196.1 XRE family transcriptional regulator [Gibbsiella quercinecans]